MPLSSVVISRVRPVSTFLTVTLAPGTAALFGSVTMPSMVAVAACCPKTGVASARTNAEAIIVARKLNKGCLRSVIGFPPDDVKGYYWLVAFYLRLTEPLAASVDFPSAESFDIRGGIVGLNMSKSKLALLSLNLRNSYHDRTNPDV